MQTHIRGGKTRHLIGVFTDKLQNVLLNLNKIKKGGELYGSFCFQKFVHFYSLNNLKSYYITCTLKRSKTLPSLLSV